ncbi:S1 family peptidase [Nocardia sp. NPDC004722]
MELSLRKSFRIPSVRAPWSWLIRTRVGESAGSGGVVAKLVGVANYLRRRAGWWGVAVVAAVALMSGVPGVGWAEDRVGEFEGVMPPGLVAAIRRDLDMDVGEYLARVEMAQRQAVSDVEVRVSGGVGLSAGEVAGGDRYLTDAGYACSWAFNAVDAEGNPAAITAGHCDAATETEDQPDTRGQTFDLTPALKRGDQTGAFEKSVMDGVRDYAVVRITEPFQDSFRNNLIRAAGGTLPITGVGYPVVGEPVCKAGATTGFTCGVILSVDQPDPLRPPVRFTHTALSLPGDSGGALFSGTLAMGIVSRGGYTDDPAQYPTDKPDAVNAVLPAPLDQIAKRLLAGDGQVAFEQLSPLIDAFLRAYPQLTMIAQSIADVMIENPGLRLRTE